MEKTFDLSDTGTFGSEGFRIGSAGIVARRERGLVEVLSYLWFRGVCVEAKTVGVLLLGVQLEL